MLPQSITTQKKGDPLPSRPFVLVIRGELLMPTIGVGMAAQSSLQADRRTDSRCEFDDQAGKHNRDHAHQLDQNVE